MLCFKRSNDGYNAKYAISRIKIGAAWYYKKMTSLNLTKLCSYFYFKMLLVVNIGKDIIYHTEL